MGRVPCCEKDNVKRGQWTPEEDNKLSSYIAQHGTRNWRLIPKNAGLQRCGKSCRLRWTNYLRPDLKHGEFSENEEQTIVKLHSVVGNRWSLIAAQLPGRTDNDVKNYWNTKLKKRLSGMGIDPVTHKPFSHLIAEIATTLAPPQVAHLAEAALGCFKDEMLHLLTKNRVDFQINRNSGAALLPNTMPPPGDNSGYCTQEGKVESDAAIQKIKFSLSRAMQESDIVQSLPSCTNKVLWGSMVADIHSGEAANSNDFDGICNAFQSSVGFHYGSTSFGNDDEGSLWNQSICTESTCTGGEHGGMHVKGEDELDDDGANLSKELNGDKSDGVFNSDGNLWDLSDDLVNPIV